MLQFKSATATASGCSGRSEPSPKHDSRWAVNPPTFKWGYICFGDGNKVLGERLVSVSQPLPDVTELPDKGFPWQEQMGGQPEVHLRRRRRHRGRLQDRHRRRHPGRRRLIEAVRDRLNGGQHDGKVAPIVQLEKDSYPHPQYGKTWVAGADRSSTGCRWTVRRRRRRRRQRRRRPPSSRVAGASPDADVHLKGEADCSGLA